MAHIRKHPITGKAQVRYMDPSGRERSKTFVRRSDARAYKSQIEHEFARGAYIDRSLSKTAFSEVAAMWLAGKVGLRRSSWVRDESHLRRHVVSFFGPYEVGSITKLMIEQWVRDLALKGLSAGTVRLKASGCLPKVRNESRPCERVPCSELHLEKPGLQPKR